MNTTNTTATAGPSLRVLVAEDNLINQRMALAMLTGLGHTGVVVGDGEKALKCLSKLKFDLVLMDVMMPVLDGLGALAAIRAQEQTTGAYMPVIMATAHTDPVEIQSFLALGADGYVAKPMEIGKLQAEFKRVLRI